MRKQVVIRIAESEAPYEVSWLVMDRAEGEQPAVIKTGTLEEAASVCEGVRAQVLVPASTVFITQVPMPTSNQRRIASAVPYALEDQLAEDIEELHFCIGKRNAQGEVATAVVAHQQMQDWQEQLQAFGVQADVITSDLFALPYQEGHWTLLLEDQSARLRTGLESGYAIDKDNIGFIVGLLLEDAQDKGSQPEGLTVYDARTEESDPIDFGDLEITQHLLHEPAISIMAQSIPKANFSLNLLQGVYSRKEQLGKMWRPWIPVGALAASLLVVNFAMALTESIQMESKANDLQQQIEKLYLEAFPGARKQTALGTIEHETKRRLAELRGSGGSGGGSDFLMLLGVVGERFSKTPGLELERVSYRAGKLDLAITIKDLQGLDVLKQQLTETKKLTVDIQSASSRNGKVAARLQVERAGA